MTENKILCILTTFKREDKAIRFLKQFDLRFSDLSNFFEIYVADDDPKSYISFHGTIDEILPSRSLLIQHHVHVKTETTY